MLLTLGEIEELCEKYKLILTYQKDGPHLYVEIISIVFNNYPCNKETLMILEKSAGTCYRLISIYNKLDFVSNYGKDILSLVRTEDQFKYKNQPHTMAELDLMVKKCVESVRLNEPHVKEFEAKKRLRQMEADFDC